MIYISTGGAVDQPAWRTAEELLGVGISKIELSGGKYDIENVSRLKKLTPIAKFKVHNYFPPPSKPFVLNLASTNREIRELSLGHIKLGIDTAVELDCTEYSFHAGFLIDPLVDELGGRVKNRSLNNRKEALSVFLDGVNTASEYASKQGIELLIENNVLADNVYERFRGDPFLMTTVDECVYVMHNTPSNTNLLVDLAHLNVSACTLLFDREMFLKKCNEWIHAFHLSDNDGESDSNERVNGSSWFWQYLKPEINYCSLEVYNCSYEEIVEQISLVERKLEIYNAQT